MRVISIATQKGGVGKTTTALEIASVMSIENDLKILLIDFDQQQNLTKYVGAKNYSTTVYDVLHNPEDIHKSILHLELFDYIPGDARLSKCDVEFTNPEDIFLLDDSLRLLSDEYDYCIIDNGPLRNKLLQMTYVASNYIICPSDDTEGGTDGLLNVYQDVKRMKNARSPLSYADIIGCIVTRYKGNTNMSQAAFKILENNMMQINPRGFVLTVRDSIKVSEAKYARIPVQKYAPYNNVSIDYRDIVQKIVEYAKEDE